MKWLRANNQSCAYLENGRLEDVLALIQVLGLDKEGRRTEKGLLEELRCSPASASTWLELARQHNEFFRVFDGKGDPEVSLITRRVLGQGQEAAARGQVPNLVESAIRIHDGQIRRRQVRWAIRIGGITLVVQALAQLVLAFPTVRATLGW